MKFKSIFLALILTAVVISCTEKPKKVNYQTINYLQVKTILDSINSLPESDLYQTWRNELCFFDTTNKKQIIFIGCGHNTMDSTHPQYLLMEEFFLKNKPQVAFNEGGNWGLKGKLKTKKEVFENPAGEIAFLQYLSDKNNIDMVNGDMPEKQEFNLLFKNNNFELCYLILALERFVNLYKMGAYPKYSIQEAFKEKFINNQLLKYGIPLSEEQKQYDYFVKTYQNYFGKPFNISETEPIDNYYLTDKNKLGEIHRKSKVIRDSVLLHKIDSALYKFDRVFVAFGASHIVALKPALKQIIEKHR